jgi:hypothetical protein
MTPLQAFLGYLGLLPLAATAMDLIARRRAALCWTFFAYLLSAMASSLVVVRWPAHFWNYAFYSAKETVHFVLLAFVAFEIWHRTFAALPRARLRVALLMVGALAGTAVALLSIPTDRAGYDVVVTIEVPRLHAGNLAVLAVLALAACWYRVPVHPLYRAILGGMTLGLTVHTLTSSLLGWLLVPDGALRVISNLNAGTYVLATVWWARSAWRPECAPEPIISRLHPWAHSW